MAKKIDFAAINSAALASFRSLLSEWLPGGEFSGSEYRVLNPTRDDNKKGSFSISTSKGVWMDFASGDAGSDPVSLFAYLSHNNDQGAAAKELAGFLGIDGKANTRGPAVRAQQQAAKAGAEPKADKPGNESPWQSILPPANAPERHQAHPVRGLPEAVWTYRGLDGAVLGYVFRFKTSDGEKETIPLTWCRHSVSGREEWRWMQWALPRPLYGLDRLTVSDVDDPKHKAPVLIVEGEKCADAAAAHFPNSPVLSWPGGCKAIGKADWSVLAGRKILIWPDCDSQREKRPKDAPDGFIPPFKPADQQPGFVAAQEIAAILSGLGCEVWVMTVPGPGELKSGWDVADAIDEGITGAALEQFVADRLVLFESAPIEKPAPQTAFKLPDTAETACAGGGGSGDDSGGSGKPSHPNAPAANAVPFWVSQLLPKPRGGYETCRTNVARLLRHHPDLQGLVGYNEFSNQIEKLKPTPWGSDTGPWEDRDNSHFDEWMTGLGMIFRNLSTIDEGVALAADGNRFHPVREWLESLAPWDGLPRLDLMLAEVTDNETSEFLRMAGRFFLIAMVARIYRPGVKFDYALVLEGAQGQGKSSFFRALADPWFSESSFEINTNEGNMAIQGVWLHEMAEMGQMARAEDTAFKSFLAYGKDKYRRPYDRRPIEVPRVCLFGGTTNLEQYLKDHSGNRRIWPVRCNTIYADWLTEHREQLFAEAIVAFRAGERFWPTRDEEKQYFEPEQAARLPIDGWEELIATYINEPENKLRNFFTTVDILLEACKVEKSKIDEANRMTVRVGRIMKKLGWDRQREPSGMFRRFGYVRPEHERIRKAVFPDPATD